MLRVPWAVAVCLGVLGLAGCEPFETEVTLNADGSGRVVYKGQLSNGARLMVREGLRRNSPLRAGFGRDAAQEWNATNAAAGVKVVAVEENVDENKRVKLRVEVTFDTLEKLSQTMWGYLLQAGAEEEDGKILLQFDDPMRSAVARLALREFRGEGSRTGRRQAEYVALIEALAAGFAGQKSRVVLNLPAPALSAEVAALSPDKRTVTMETSVAEGEAGLNAWLARRAPVVTLPGEFAGIKTFGTPASLPDRSSFSRTTPTPAPAAPVAPADGAAKGAEEYRFRLNTLSLMTNRTLNMGEGDLEPQRSDSFTLQFHLYGPEQANVLRPVTRGDEASPCIITTAKDSEGNDLRNPDARSYLNLYGSFGDGYRRGKDQPLGNLQLGLAVPAAGVKSIAKLRGYATLIQVTEEGKLEIKPLKDNLDKEYVLGEQTIKFLSVKGTAIQYVLSIGESPVALKFHNGDGKEVSSSGWSSSGGGEGRTTFTRNTNEAIGDGGYVVVRYPVKTQQIRIPISYDNLQIP